MNKRGPKKKNLRDRFFSHVVKGEDPKSCWSWVGATRPFGYGAINVDGINTRAHRLSWELHFGPIPTGLCVLHSCDNPPCCNPDHLFLGSKKNNTEDMLKKRRNSHVKHPENIAMAARHRKLRLSSEDVRSIRSSTESAKHLAGVFGISESMVYMVKLRMRYKNVN